MVSRLIYSSLLVTFLLTESILGAPNFVPLSDARARLKLPKYTANDRVTLATQAEFMIKNLYVHREIKLKDFGTSIDPVVRLGELKKVAKDLSNEEFHEKISKIFLDLHDLHTNYNAPAPLACGVSLVPLKFESVVDAGKKVIVVSRKLAIHPEVTKDISVADELLEVDGVNVENVLSSLSEMAAGANPDASRSRAVQLLSLRSHTSQPVPKNDSVKFTFQGASGKYDVEVPWYAYINETCMLGARVQDFLRNRLWYNMNLAEDEYQKRYNRVFGTPSLVNPETTWAKPAPLSDVFEVVALDTPAGKIGYIRLKAFYWDDEHLDIATVIEGFRNEVETKLSTTIGLVIDVRGNPGGLIVLAEKLVQLFSKVEVQPTTVRMLPNELNEKIFLKANGADNRWSKAIREALKNKLDYTAPLAITPVTEANSLGQVWFRPVVVLTDASCYSACDLFSAGIQDSGAGVVIGLHNNTGAGGANVMEYNVFRAIMGSATDNPFTKLPFNQNMRVSWRQTLRAGKHNGELIEDAGIKSDIVVPLQKGDIGGESKVLMKQIHKIVDELTPKYQSGLEVRRGNSVLLDNGNSAIWKEKAYGVDSIDVFVKGKKESTLTLPLTSTPSEVEVSLNNLKGDWYDEPVLLVGKNNGKQAFRVVRELMWRGEYAPIAEKAETLDFEKESIAPFHTVLLKGNSDEGWQIKDGKLRVGKGPEYGSNVLTRVFTSLKLDGKAGLMTFDFDLEAEDTNDSLRIYAVNPESGERFNYFAGSNVGHQEGISIEFPTDWVKADVVFEFESDENWNMQGPVIDNLKLER